MPPRGPILFVGAIITVVLIILKFLGAVPVEWLICWTPLLVALLVVALLGWRDV